MKRASRALVPGAILIMCVLIYTTFYWDRQMNTSPFAEEVAAAYPDAPEDVRRIAEAIRAGDILDPTLLSQIGSDALSEPYVGTNNQRSVLLNDTMLHRNLAAAEALIAAGADVRYSDDLMVFNALSMREGPILVPFQNFSPGLPFLRLYLENGGDPEAKYYRDNTGQTPLLYSFNNLAGALMLLEYGADPWRQPLFPEGTPMRSYFDRRVGTTANGVYAELFFRLVHAGHMKGASPDQIAPIMDTLERFLDQSITSGRERDIYTTWQLQQIIQAVIATTGIVPTANQTRLLAQPVPEKYAGWFMEPDQLFSGDEAEGPPIPDVGNFVWTHADPTPRPRSTP